ncbi:nitroreductase family protein [Marinobacter sp. PE14]
MNTMLELIKNRKTTGRYDLSFKISASEVAEIAEFAFQSPSAFNLQNWKVIAVHSNEKKEKLYEAAYCQEQILDASVTYIICGNSLGYKNLEFILQGDVEHGIIPENIKKSWVDMASASHESNELVRRDEAIRSASLLAMSLIYAAEAKGYDTGSVGGFDPDMVKQFFALEGGIIPVVLVTVGRAAEGNWSKKTRRPIKEVFELI